jgi:GT2 family glycosyltransferase
MAERVAEAGDPDHLLWLNDDVVLDQGAIALLSGIAATERDCIVVGALRDPRSGALTYSGVERTGVHPLRMRWIEPADRPIEVETFNGNVVLVPRAVRARVGRLDGALVHAAADFDYGLRAKQVGVRNLLAPGSVGTCTRVGDRAPWLDRSAPLKRRLDLLLSPKGLPPAPRARYLKRHGGRAWPVFWAWPYLRAVRSLLLPHQVGARAR